jgi:hypothetical protein
MTEAEYIAELAAKAAHYAALGANDAAEWASAKYATRASADAAARAADAAKELK